jgi:hypothetical protein
LDYDEEVAFAFEDEPMHDHPEARLARPAVSLSINQISWAAPAMSHWQRRGLRHGEKASAQPIKYCCGEQKMPPN